MRLLAFSWLVLTACGPYETNTDAFVDCTNEHGGLGTCRDERGVCLKALTSSSVPVCRQTCVEDADCTAAAPGDRPVVCETFSRGQYCAVACDGGDDCPADTTCSIEHRFDGNTVKLCL